MFLGMGMNSPSSSALPGVLSGNEMPQDAVAIRDPRSEHKKSSTEIPGRLLKKSNLIAREASRQVFPQRQRPRHCSRPASQWWQLQFPLRGDSSFQSSKVVASWELDLSQE